MLRSLLLLLHLLIALNHVDVSALDLLVERLSADVAAQADCCGPGKADAPGGSCCDYDFGRCCAPGVIALIAQPSALLAQRLAQRALLRVPTSALRVRRHISASQAYPHTTGPPPTPPPIA